MIGDRTAHMMIYLDDEKIFSISQQSKTAVEEEALSREFIEENRWAVGKH